MTREALLEKLLSLPEKISVFMRARVLRIAAVCLLVGALAAVFGLRASARSYIYVVYLDGQEIGAVSDDQEILNFVAMLYDKESRAYGLEVQPIQEINVEKEHRPGARPADWDVKDHLRRNLEFDVYAYMIMVNDQPTLAVRSMADYDKVLEQVKSSYTSGKDNSVVKAIVVSDKVEARLMPVDPDIVYSADRAADVLRRGTEKRETYMVSRGDNVWTIARRNNMTVNELKDANPRLKDSDFLQVGDELELVVPEPIVHVSVTEDVTLTERIPFGTTYQNDSKLYKGTTKVITPGRYGYKEVTYRITQENGQEVQREILKEVITEEPRTQVVARGTATAPVRGSGLFAWPVSGGGRITSGYGYRGRRFHYGVDIGAPNGTPVIAADSGVIIFSGWAGSYGNLITIDHGNGYITKYAHNSALLVPVGKKVQKGEQIARVGSTGNSTGPHLHFEILRNGSHLNPVQFF